MSKRILSGLVPQRRLDHILSYRDRQVVGMRGTICMNRPSNSTNIYWSHRWLAFPGSVKKESGMIDYQTGIWRGDRPLFLTKKTTDSKS